MKLGVTQYTASRDGKHFVEAAGRLGVTGVEPCITSVESEFLRWSPQQIHQLKDQARQFRVEIPSVALTHFNGDPSLVTTSGFEAANRIITDALQFTGNLGAKVLMICTFIESHPDTPVKKSNLLRVVQSIEPAARALGITIALETPLAAEELIDLLDRAASDHIRAYYDFGNAIAMGLDPAREIPLLGRRIIAIHAKDSAHGKLASLHFGKGDLDLPAAMQATRSIGFDGWLLLETPGGDNLSLAADLRLLRSAL